MTNIERNMERAASIATQPAIVPAHGKFNNNSWAISKDGTLTVYEQTTGATAPRCAYVDVTEYLFRQGFGIVKTFDLTWYYNKKAHPEYEEIDLAAVLAEATQ